MIIKFIRSLYTIGLLGTFKKIILYPIRSARFYRNRNEIMKLADSESRFTRIYETNYWNSEESVSGSGSTLGYTKKLRSKLPDIFKKFSIGSIFDAPCGDFKWMAELLKTQPIIYIGGDIVKPLVDNLNATRYSVFPPPTFLYFDITKDNFPKVDLWVCRDCLFHLSYNDTWLALNKFIDSGIHFVLTTTHCNFNHFVNTDIQSGQFKFIDLFSHPYFFPNPLYRIQDWEHPDSPREMCLWSRDQIMVALRNSTET
jgi:hypothetical protein